MTEICRKFGISRKTGYKLFDRYQECGVQGLTDRSRRPYRYAAPRPRRQRLRSNLPIARARAGHIFALRRRTCR
jgi:transposase